MRPDEAGQFYEDDEEPGKVFAIFDAAKRDGRLGRTQPPAPRSELAPLRVLLTQLARDVWRDLRQLQLRERARRLLRTVAQAVESRGKVH